MFDDLADPLGPPEGDALGKVRAKARRRRVMRRTAGAVAVVAVVAIGGVATVIAAGSSPAPRVQVAGTPTSVANPTTHEAPNSVVTTTTTATTVPPRTTTVTPTTLMPAVVPTTTTMVVPTTTTTTVLPPLPPSSTELHAQLSGGGQTDMAEVGPNNWTVRTIIDNAPQNKYSVGVTTAQGKQVFFNTICEFTGQGTIGCMATVNLDQYLPGGKPINVSVMAYDPSSNGYLAYAQGTFQPTPR